MALIKIKRGNLADIPELEDGEFYLAKDENRLIISNNSVQLYIANYSELNDLSQQLSSLSNVVNTISENLTQLNSTMETKVTKPEGQAGQVLGFNQELDIVALDVVSGNNINLSSSQPTGQQNGDLWLKIV